MARMDLRLFTMSLLSSKLVSLSGAARGTVFCVDEVKEELFFFIDTADGKKLEIRIPLTPKSIAGFSILNKATINIPDCYRDSRFDPSTDKKSGFKTTQMLCVPLSNHDGKVIGAIQLINSRSGMSFDANDEKLIEAFGVYVQAALENLRNKGAVECAHKQVSSGVSINGAMAMCTSLPHLLEVTFNHICEISRCDYVALYLPPTSHRQMESGPGKGEDPPSVMLRYDNKSTQGAPFSRAQVSVSPKTMLQLCSEFHGFMNVCITVTEVKRSRLETFDVYHGVNGNRAWVEAVPDDVQPPIFQGSSKPGSGQARCVQEVDFPLSAYLKGMAKGVGHRWSNMLMIPIPTCTGTCVIQIAGKDEEESQCFTVADEELLVLIGSMFVSMVRARQWEEREANNADNDDDHIF